MAKTTTTLQELLGIEHPIIVAPMFLVSNVKMVTAAMQKNIAGCIPALNYRTDDALKKAILKLQKAKTAKGAFGINIIVMPVTSHFSNIICWFHMVTCDALSKDVGVGKVVCPNWIW